LPFWQTSGDRNGIAETATVAVLANFGRRQLRIHTTFQRLCEDQMTSLRGAFFLLRKIFFYNSKGTQILKNGSK
jgi:hypothetical protein